ncbi:PREDICTED: kinesin-like protein KIN-14G isoform X2 [Nelumbo nucifera]|uniref:Kinesin-like protein KIN-14G isoform X2 n=2 Tax=Nelumbo nucifera TaxID=4432 RepID=A0A1U8APL1_NELNU|nr:PREDICTED: kinesin-like protein KIN-14G isoform X2 [Nelumbo nucifera]DAD29626.1 TPA_asm: hypothetical protein HUJ06_031094 [Nelumbo nucifera]
MEEPSRTTLHDFHLASRKAEEAALRRYHAAEWLESLVGPLGIPSQPSERDFVSCLRNGLILCNAINKIQPGAVPKVVESHSQSPTLEAQPLPAYQHFENVRNFLVAVNELKLPTFEASDLERDNLEVGSAAKVVDCILALKIYQEWKNVGVNGSCKYAKSPMVPHSANRMHSRVSAAISSEPFRRLDLSAAPSDKQLTIDVEKGKHEDSLVRAITECLFATKENIDQSLLTSFRHGKLDSVQFLTKIMPSCSQDKQLYNLPELKQILKDPLGEGNIYSTPTPVANSSPIGKSRCCRSCLTKGNCKHWRLLEVQEKDLLELKELLSRTKREFELLQSQWQGDLQQLGIQVQELSSSALGYQRVVKENRDLYNKVQDLKGNIRVYCRVRPTLSNDTKNAIDFIGEDGSLVVLDPSKPQKGGQKVFCFNRVFGPTSTQEEIFKETKPLIRSVLDGYNVCIFAYGQTGSGKTYTMCGPSGGSTKDRGVNYLALNDLFQISCKRKDIINYDVQVQMIEIYNEQIRDLLAEESSDTKLEIRSCTSNGGFGLPDATIHPVKSTMDVLHLMEFGEMNRVVSSTAVNNRSSRSHSILSVHVNGKDISGSILRSCLHLVDLAGSERVDKSEVTGDRLREAQYINKSLSCLGDVINALAQKNSHIPYRNSKLTQLLQESLGGHSKTLMFAHVSPEEASYGETISTLKFAQRVSTIELGASRLNKESSEVRELREQVERLKKALASKQTQTPKLNIGVRRLLTENSIPIKTNKVVNTNDRKGSKTPIVKTKPRTQHTPIRSRRLSLEGPMYRMEQLQIKKSDVSLISKERIVQQHVSVNSSQNDGEAPCTESDQCQDAKEVKLCGGFINGNSTMEVDHWNAPRSPISAYQSEKMETESRKRTPPLQLLKTPEPQNTRHGIQIRRQKEPDLSNKSLTPSSASDMGRKGSQIKKSLQAIGKLINGSEKRNKQYQVEILSPIHAPNNVSGGKSPRTANSRASRRQSLTGAQSLTSDRSRRSSLGGKLADSRDYKLKFK